MYEENALALNAFMVLQTQWRIVVGGMGAPIHQGIDYASVPFVFEMLNVPQDQRVSLFDDLRVMEAAAVQAIAALRGEARNE